MKLLERANMDQPLLRELMVQAPGTYHHSIIVGNMVEAAAEAIEREYGVKAEIKFWPVGSAIGILTSFFGIILTPPSYVFINEKKTVEPKKNFKKDFGIIALAGPAVNIFAAAVLIALSSFSPGIFLYAAKISFLIATINLLPVGSLDGLKIARWSWVVWLASIILAAGGFVLIR